MCKEKENGMLAELPAGIKPGQDAVFLPGKIHGSTDQVYIIYLNECARDGNGSFEIEIIDYERILKLYQEVEGNYEDFFAILPDWFHGEWYYCDFDDECYSNYAEDYHKADFIVGRDGGLEEELAFLVKWAREREDYYRSLKNNSEVAAS